ncbi:hypothetical protein [Pseudomonas phage BHU-1]|nr:hypothetical protein [Pseudomonas phage BHU-1]
MGSIKMYVIGGLALVAVGLLGVLGTWGAWEYRGRISDRELKAEQDRMAGLLKKQTELTDQYRNQADKVYSELLDRIDNIKVVNTTINKTIQAEKIANPSFYAQPLPPGGREAWLKARMQLQ